MKRLVSVILVIVLASVLFACSGDDNGSNGDSGGSNWKQFLRDYESWADELIEMSAKFEDGDMSLLDEYIKKLEEMPEWVEKWGEILVELTIEDDQAVLEEFEAEAERIGEKYSAVFGD